MGTPVPISLGVRSNPSRHSKQAGNARLINCFAEPLGDEGKTQWVITGDAGLINFGSALSGGGIRSAIEVDGYLYVVAGRQLYKVDATGISTNIGGIPTDGPVYMRRNRRVPTQIGIVSDGYYAVIDTGALTEISDPDLPPPTSLAYLDGYGILPIAGGNYMITAIDDFTSIDGLDESTANANPDPIIRAHELGREVVFFGTKSTEWHQDTGDADFPLQRSQSVELGWLAADSVAPYLLPAGLTLIGVASDHSVKMLQGYGAQAISTPDIQNRIRLLDEAGRASELKATSWSWGGRNFYCLSCADWTYQFDGANWHERKSYGSNRWRVSNVVPFGGKLIACDATTGQLYQMLDEAYDEAGEPHIAEIITPPVHAFPFRGRANTLFLDAASGVGLNSAAPQYLDPVMLVDWSKDGGDTWSAEREVPLGRLGKTATRLPPIRRLGAFGQKGLTFRLRISCAVQKLIMAAALDFDKLAA